MSETAAATPYERLILNRFGLGFNQRDLAAMRRAGSPLQWLRDQLAAALLPVASSPTEVKLREYYPDLYVEPGDKWGLNVSGKKGAVAFGNDLANWSLIRRIETFQPVRERLVDLWSAVFNVPTGHDRAFTWRFEFDREIRDNCAGRFSSLLKLVTMHPAMLLYMDTWRSTTQAPNQNHARELLELHSVGLTAGYTERDVIDCARILTGFKLQTTSNMSVVYDVNAHAVGPVSVLGFKHENKAIDGRPMLDQFLTYLGTHDATARHICRRIASYFTGAEVTEALVQRLAATFSASGSSISAIILELARSAEFLDSDGKKMLSPWDDLVRTAKVLQIEITQPPIGQNYARAANGIHGGPGLYEWFRPDGPPTHGDYWTSPSRMLASSRMHVGHALSSHPTGAQYVRPDAWMPTARLSLDELTDHLSRRWFGKAADERMKICAAQSVGFRRTEEVDAGHAVFRYLWPRLALTLLDSPDHMMS